MYLYPKSSRIFEDDIIDIDLSDGTSDSPVTGVSTSSGRLITSGSDAVLYFNFGYTGNAKKITAKIHVTRLARIQDVTIQLWNGTKLVGKNLANPDASDTQLYKFTGNFNVTPDFGIVVDVGPSQKYPSANTVYIRSVALEFA